jgi:hypothetical protein
VGVSIGMSVLEPGDIFICNFAKMSALNTQKKRDLFTKLGVGNHLHVGVIENDENIGLCINEAFDSGDQSSTMSSIKPLESDVYWVNFAKFGFKDDQVQTLKSEMSEEISDKEKTRVTTLAVVRGLFNKVQPWTSKVKHEHEFKKEMICSSYAMTLVMKRLQNGLNQIKKANKEADACKKLQQFIDEFETKNILPDKLAEQFEK